MSNKNNQIRKLQLSGQSYDIAVRKDWLENNIEDVPYIENRTHFVRSIEDPNKLSAGLSSGKFMATAGATYCIYTANEEYNKLFAAKTSYLIYFPTVDELEQAINEVNTEGLGADHDCPFDRQIVLDGFALAADSQKSIELVFNFDTPFANGLKDYKATKAELLAAGITSSYSNSYIIENNESIAYNVNFLIRYNDGSLPANQEATEFLDSLFFGKAEIKLLDAPYIPIDKETIQIDADGKLSSANALARLKQDYTNKFASLDSLKSVMNFRGVVNSPNSIADPKHGDIIVLASDYEITAQDRITVRVSTSTLDQTATPVSSSEEVEEGAAGNEVLETTELDLFAEITDTPLIDYSNSNPSSGSPVGTILPAGTELIYVVYVSDSNDATANDAGWHEIGIGDALIKELKKLTTLHKDELDRLDTALETKFNADEQRFDDTFVELVKILREGLVLDGGFEPNTDETNPLPDIKSLYYGIESGYEGEAPIYKIPASYSFTHSEEDSVAEDTPPTES